MDMELLGIDHVFAPHALVPGSNIPVNNPRVADNL